MGGHPVAAGGQQRGNGTLDVGRSRPALGSWVGCQGRCVVGRMRVRLRRGRLSDDRADFEASAGTLTSAVFVVTSAAGACCTDTTATRAGGGTAAIAVGSCPAGGSGSCPVGGAVPLEGASSVSWSASMLSTARAGSEATAPLTRACSSRRVSGPACGLWTGSTTRRSRAPARAERRSSRALPAALRTASLAARCARKCQGRRW